MLLVSYLEACILDICLPACAIEVKWGPIDGSLCHSKDHALILSMIDIMQWNE